MPKTGTEKPWVNCDSVGDEVFCLEKEEQEGGFFEGVLEARFRDQLGREWLLFVDREEEGHEATYLARADICKLS